MHLDEEGRLESEGQDSLLDHGALDVVVLDDNVFLENFDCVQLVRAFALGQHHLKTQQQQNINGIQI